MCDTLNCNSPDNQSRAEELDGCPLSSNLPGQPKKIDNIVPNADCRNSLYGGDTEYTQFFLRLSPVEQIFFMVHTIRGGNMPNDISHFEDICVPRMLPPGTQCNLEGKTIHIRDIKRNEHGIWTITDAKDNTHEIELPTSQWYEECIELETSKRGREMKNTMNALRMREFQKKVMQSEQNTTLSEEDFYEYFLQKKGLQQKNIGNCYLIAEIDAISQCPYFELLIRTSLKRLSNNNWEVKIPFMNPHGHIITCLVPQ